MPFSIRFYNPCVHSNESTIVSSVPCRSSSSIKSILRRCFSRKHSTIIQDIHPQQLSSDKFQRTNKSNILREVKSKRKSHSKSKKANNYDMTILHDDELNNTRLAIARRRKKNIPSWANKEQLELAIINQVYFQDKKPEDIFGAVCIEDVFNLIHSIDIKNKESISTIVSRHFL